MTEIVEYSTAFHEKYHQLNCLHFGRNKIVLAYNEYFRFTKVATSTFSLVFFEIRFIFVQHVLRYGTMNFLAVFYGPPCRKANRRQLAYEKTGSMATGKRQGVRTEKGDEGTGNDGYSLDRLM